MKEAIMDALMFLIFASQVLHIFGNVTVLRGSLLSDKVKLICLSEDDGGALVWNYNLIWKSRHPMQNNLNFRNLNEFNNNEINCKMNANKGCLESWTKHDWRLTNSLKTPMGPVFDQRWEEFNQYQNFEDTYSYIDLKLVRTRVTFSFSVRASRNVNILFCNGKNYRSNSCYWIIIGGWNNTMSVIRKCVTGVPEESEIDSQCQKAQVFIEHTPLSENEWRSFIITWDSMIKAITVYDAYNMIMTYTDNEKQKLSYTYYQMFLRSNTTMLFRLHRYDFLHTTVENAVLTSPVFQFNNETICIQLLIGLCAECDAHIKVLRNHTREVLEEVTVKGSKIATHGLPLWQSVKIKSNSIDYSHNGPIIIKLTPKLNDNSFNPLWAIANVHQCPQNGALRKGVIISNQKWEEERGYFWPNVTCQKLFYDEHAVVYSMSRAKPNVNLDDANCPEEKIGPQCLVSCKHDLDTKSDCKETEICYEDGCTCAPGFSGNNCSESCQSNTYGHNCKKTCGSCLYKTLPKELCNKVTGVCDEGCDNTKNVYIPPLCQTSIDKPNTVITFTSKTTIWALVSVTWKDEYEKISIFYSFAIKGQNKYYIQQLDNRLFRNMTHLIGYFDDLKSGSTYQIRCSLRIADIEIHSDWEMTETECIPAENFDVTSEKNSIIINWRINPNQYSCAANWYYLKVRNVNTNELIVSELATSFPYKLQSLPSYTSFEVTIFHENDMLFSQEIRTLDEVLDLRSNVSANTQLTLIWRPPNQPNEKIVRYEVILKVKEYYGCKILNRPTPDNHIITKSTTETTITIPDLHPYTSYSAQVIAHNSRHFSISAEINFETAQSEIPSEVFSQPRVQKWTLSWLPPEDCTTISGPLKARIKIHGISDAVKYFNVIRQTSYNYIYLDRTNPKLNGAERYNATVYVIRDYKSKENISAYQKYEFETPPTAPPNVNNLEVVEIDTRQMPAMIHLRWQSPLPPLNGKLREYGVQLYDTYNGRYSVQVQLNEFCELWDGYICKVVKQPKVYSQLSIQVFAYNMNVTEPGPPVFVTKDMLRNTTPDEPGNYTYTVNNNSVVDLKWLHPWKTGGHLKSFRIQIVETSSNLTRRFSRSGTNKTYPVIQYPVIPYMRNYSKQLYLFPSTQYFIYIEAVTTANKSSNIKFVEIHTPSSAGFDGDVIIDESNSTIVLNIPRVLNDTQDNMMHIIVKGPNLCSRYSKVPENLRERAGVKMNETAWQAAELLTSELAGKRFRIGDYRSYGNGRNCPLALGDPYEIVIIVTDRNSFTEPIMLAKSIRNGDVPLITFLMNHYKEWLIPIILLLVMILAAFYYYRRKRQKRIEQLTRETDMIQNIANYEREMRFSMIWNSKQDMSTPFDRQSLSPATTPEVPPITIANGEEEEEMISLDKINDFEDYVKNEIQSELLDKQYEATTPELPPIAIANGEEEEEMISLDKINDFGDYFRNAIQSGLLDKQNVTFLKGQTRQDEGSNAERRASSSIIE